MQTKLNRSTADILAHAADTTDAAHPGDAAASPVTA